MKIVSTIVLVIFWLATVTVFAAGLILYQNNFSTIAAPNNELTDNFQIQNKNAKAQEYFSLPVEGKTAQEAASNDQSNGSLANNAASNVEPTNVLENISAANPATLLNPTPTTAPTPTDMPIIYYTAALIATHNSPADCWIIVNNKVYDVTNYLPFHPGGINAILSYCGKDDSSAFAGLPHSQNANNLLATYFVGNLGSTPAPTPVITPAITPSVSPNLTSTPTATPLPSPSSMPRQPQTYTIQFTQSGSFQPSSLTINSGDTIKFQYIAPFEDEINIQFSPNPPSSIKLDHDRTNRSYTFLQKGTWIFQTSVDQGTINVR